MASRDSSLLSVWREDPGLLSGPCRKRRPSPRDEGGVSGVSSSCGARGGFLTRHDEDHREPLVRRQGSQVSMHVARGRASLLSSHGRGIRPQDAMKKDSRGLSRVVAGIPGYQRLVSVTSGTFSGCLREVGDTVELGGASPDSTGFGAMEDGLISS